MVVERGTTLSKERKDHLPLQPVFTLSLPSKTRLGDRNHWTFYIQTHYQVLEMISVINIHEHAKIMAMKTSIAHKFANFVSEKASTSIPTGTWHTASKMCVCTCYKLHKNFRRSECERLEYAQLCRCNHKLWYLVNFIARKGCSSSDSTAQTSIGSSQIMNLASAKTQNFLADGCHSYTQKFSTVILSPTLYRVAKK